MMTEQIRILFDGPPGPESGRFIEVENKKGESISIGEWVQEGDMWYLEFPDIRNEYETLKAATERFVAYMDEWYSIRGKVEPLKSDTEDDRILKAIYFDILEGK